MTKNEFDEIFTKSFNETSDNGILEIKANLEKAKNENNKISYDEIIPMLFVQGLKTNRDFLYSVLSKCILSDNELST